MAFDFGMLSGMLPGGQTQIPPTWGFEGPPPAIDPLTGMPMPAPKTELPKPAPFGPFPGVQLPGLQNDLAPTPAPAGPPTATASGMPGWIEDQTSAPAGIGGPSASPAPVPQPRPAPAPTPEGDASLPPGATLASGPAPMGLTPSPAPSAPPAPGLMDRLSAASHNLSAKPGLPGIFDAISGLSSGARTDPRGMAQQTQNQTFAALVKRGLDPDTAAAAVGNPEVLKQLIPSLFGGKKLINVNGVMVDEATGQKVADYSEAQKWIPTTVKNPRTGDDETVLYQASTGAYKPMSPNGVVQPQNPGAASAHMTLPPEVKNMPPSLQFKNAPDGSTATLAGRPVIKRGGRWEYVQ